MAADVAGFEQASGARFAACRYPNPCPSAATAPGSSPRAPARFEDEEAARASAGLGPRRLSPKRHAGRPVQMGHAHLASGGVASGGFASSRGVDFACVPFASSSKTGVVISPPATSPAIVSPAGRHHWGLKPGPGGFKRRALPTETAGSSPGASLPPAHCRRLARPEPCAPQCQLPQRCFRGILLGMRAGVAAAPRVCRVCRRARILSGSGACALLISCRG